MLAIINNAAVNIGVHISIQVVFSFSLAKCAIVKLLDHIIFLFLIF